MDLIRVERELKKRLEIPYVWGRKQSNEWDKITNFIYHTYSLRFLLRELEGFDTELKNYALNRWYNFWSAMAVEYIFSCHKNVSPNVNNYDKLVDFSINNIPFDHKTSVFPRGFSHNITYAKEHPLDLIKWLYNNQSQENRKHLKNRLFIVLYDSSGDHWKLKSEIELIRIAIDKYVNTFSEELLKKLYFDDEMVVSDILWIER